MSEVWSLTLSWSIANADYDQLLLKVGANYSQSVGADYGQLLLKVGANYSQSVGADYGQSRSLKAVGADY